MASRFAPQSLNRYAPMLIVTLLLVLLTTAQVAAQDFMVDGLIDIQECTDSLTAADANGDSRIDTTEYVAFARALGPPNFLPGVDQFQNIPLPLVSNFNFLACLCVIDPDTPEDERETCCDNTSDFFEIPTGDPLTDSQEVNLFTICSFTKNAIDNIVASLPPTPIPSTAPSVTPMPSAAPNEDASEAPSATPDTDATGAPSPAPVEGPGVTTEVANVVYTVGIRSGTETSFDEYSPLLIASMDSLSNEVLSELDDTRRRLLRTQYRRRLRTASIPTTLTLSIADVGCQAGTTAQDGDSCNEVASAIEVIFQPEETIPADFTANYEEALGAAINEGRLQTALNLQDPDAPVFIVVPVVGGGVGGGGDREATTVGAGGIAGIVIGAAAVIGIVLIGFIWRRRGKDPYDDLNPVEGDLALDDGATRDLDLDLDKDAAAGEVAADGPSAKKKHPLQTEIEGMPAMALEDADEDREPGGSVHDSSSNAGSSGWSSSAGVSSLNTGSADGLDEPVVGPAASSALAAMGAAQSRAPTDESEASVPVVPTVTRADLDSAIEAGDWAAVGATAALLAAASDSQSYSSKSGQTRSRSGSSVGSLDAARAAELDHLVDAGDWEGIVLAAAKYEAAEGNSQPSIASGSESRESRSSVGESGTFLSGSASMSQSSSPSKLKKRQELRSQVEELVQRVVPEEIQNVDEMMSQFRGREEELVETLRTMQERAVAQKARQGAQKAAKQEAKRAVKASRRDLAVTGGAAAGGAGAGAVAGGAAAGAVAGPLGAAAGVAAGAAIGAAAAVGVASSSDAPEASTEGAGGVRTISLGVGTAQPAPLSRPPEPGYDASTGATAGSSPSDISSVAAAGTSDGATAGSPSVGGVGSSGADGFHATPALAVAAMSSLGGALGKRKDDRPHGSSSNDNDDDDDGGGKMSPDEILLKPSVDSPSKPFTDEVASVDVSSKGSPSLSSPSGSFPNSSARSMVSALQSNTPASREIRQSVLEAAIEAGDWEAVGEAAAMLSDNSMTSADTDEVDRIARGISSGSSTGSDGKGVSADRAAELDELIEKGDWTGVVAAASRFSNDEEGSPKRSESFIDRQRRQRELEERRERRLQRMKEEQDALAQAEIWMAIADQSKQDTASEVTGASDAADWAIARSLSLLVRAEQGGQLEDTDEEAEEV